MSEVCRVVNFHLRALAHIRKYLDKHTANTLAACIIGSRIDYCNSLFAGLSDSNLLCLQRLQNRATRIVMNSKGIVSCTELLRELHWLPVVNRIDFKVALLTFKAITTQQPAYLWSSLVPYTVMRGLRSSSQHLLTVPHTRINLQ